MALFAREGRSGILGTLFRARAVGRKYADCCRRTGHMEQFSGHSFNRRLSVSAGMPRTRAARTRSN